MNVGMRMCTSPAKPTFRPGDVVNFHAVIKSNTAGIAGQALLAEPPTGNITAQLLTPQGYLVSSLSLKSDTSGAISGLFSLAPTVLPGTWTIHIRSGDAGRDFPLTVVPSSTDTLSVAVLPNRIRRRQHYYHSYHKCAECRRQAGSRRVCYRQIGNNGGSMDVRLGGSHHR